MGYRRNSVIGLSALSCCVLPVYSVSSTYSDISPWICWTISDGKRMKRLREWERVEDYWESKRSRDATCGWNGEGSMGLRGNGGDLARNEGWDERNAWLVLFPPYSYRDVAGGIDTEGGRKRERDELTGCWWGRLTFGSEWERVRRMRLADRGSPGFWQPLSLRGEQLDFIRRWC